MSATLALAEQLIACRSVTPEDGGCQALLAARLEAIGFDCTSLPFGPDAARVSNLWAIRRGTAADGKLLVFAGHTDVVPTGPLSAWSQRPVRADPARRHALRPRRRRHEELDRGDGRRRRGVRRRRAGACAAASRC